MRQQQFTIGLPPEYQPMTTQEQLTDAFADALMIDKSAMTDDLAYQSIPAWDSISHMILITNLEAAFDVSLTTDDVIALSSVGKAKEILGIHGINF